MKSICIVCLAAVVFAGMASGGVIIPSLDDGTALGTYTAARNGLLNEVPKITTGKITLAARFNPDISQMTAGPVIVIENGGTSNGTGLYLASGNLIFAAKAANGRYAVPTSLNDTDFANEGGLGKSMAVSAGPVNFGQENIVYASMDIVSGKLFICINGVGSLYTITNSTGTENLDGNCSVSFLGVSPIPSDQYGWLGGLLEDNGTNNALSLYPQLFWMNAVPMIQTPGYANQLGQIFAAYVPEPASLVLLGGGAFFLRPRRHL
ncbi:MAG: PEP-CTERM sorting domain-containing protein [Anaerohalosphaeraceae bacterium]